MKCDGVKIFAYLEGISTDQERNEMEDHLKGCEKCRKEIEELNFAIETFAQFYTHRSRGGCPSGEELISFKYGMMDEGHASEIRWHVDRCAQCQEELRFVEGFEKEKHLHDPVEPPPLSQEILARIEELKRDSVRNRMENVLRSILAKGKGAITADKIPEFLDQYFARVPDTSPAYAIPSDATLSDTDLTLREFSLLTDVTLDIGGYRICLKSSGDSLTVSIQRQKKAVSDVEVRVKTQSFGEFKGHTDTDGSCVIEGVPPGPCRLKICMPDDNEKASGG